MNSEVAKADKRLDENFRCRCDNQSASARCTCNNNASHRRSASPSSNVDVRHNAPPGHCADGAVDSGARADLFIRGIHPDLTEIDMRKVFEKYGEVEHCRIMRHSVTKRSRGFGFVGMATPKQAEAAQQGLHGRAVEGSMLIIEKSRPIPSRHTTSNRNSTSAKRAIRRGNYERSLVDHELDHISREYNRYYDGGRSSYDGYYPHRRRRLDRRGNDFPREHDRWPGEYVVEYGDTERYGDWAFDFGPRRRDGRGRSSSGHSRDFAAGHPRFA
ncbi:hypothetical protein Purlil1_13357 [Purpureocillium lilacinum]|uniref:RRM domain-containing protein n=1 Tax=Purpureocillium lilacinum TaxID=33203 RepID=A0ABR0BEC0_PURLI|nr:hypothetical protein Purlil1_13357 [Purpureocillium lilacinum]